MRVGPAKPYHTKHISLFSLDFLIYFNDNINNVIYYYIMIFLTKFLKKKKLKNTFETTKKIVSITGRGVLTF